MILIVSEKYIMSLSILMINEIYCRISHQQIRCNKIYWLEL